MTLDADERDMLIKAANKDDSGCLLVILLLCLVFSCTKLDNLSQDLQEHTQCTQQEQENKNGQ